MPTGFNKPWHQRLNQLIFYFKTGTNEMHFYDIENDQVNMERLDGDYKFYEGHRSIIGPDGHIYIFGGYPTEGYEE